MSGKVPPSLTAKLSLNQSRYSGKLNIPIPRIDLFKSSLNIFRECSVFGTHSPTLLDYHPVLKLVNHVTCHTLCADWLALPVIFGHCNPPEPFCHIVYPIYHAFTHQMFATDDFIAPYLHLHSCLSHIMFDV